MEKSVPASLRRVTKQAVQAGQELIGVFMDPDKLAARLEEQKRDEEEHTNEVVKVLEVDIADTETGQTGLLRLCEMALDILQTSPPDESAQTKLNLIGTTLTTVPGYPLAGLDLPPEGIGLLRQYYAIPPPETFLNNLPPPTPSPYGDF